MGWRRRSWLIWCRRWRRRSHGSRRCGWRRCGLRIGLGSVTWRGWRTRRRGRRRRPVRSGARPVATWSWPTSSPISVRSPRRSPTVGCRSRRRRRWPGRTPRRPTSRPTCWTPRTSLSLTELERRVERFNLDRDRPAAPVVPAVTITPTRGGVKIDGTLDALGGEIVTTALDAAADKLSFEKGTGRGRTARCGADGDRPLLLGAPHRRHPSARTTPRRGQHPAWPCCSASPASAVLGSGAVIDAATARQLACDASVSRLITGPASEPLDVGRATRSIPTAIARQLIIEDQHCRHPGCSAPVWACEAHHVIFWEGPLKGETKLDQPGAAVLASPPPAAQGPRLAVRARPDHPPPRRLLPRPPGRHDLPTRPTTNRAGPHAGPPNLIAIDRRHTRPVHGRRCMTVTRSWQVRVLPGDQPT